MTFSCEEVGLEFFDDSTTRYLASRGDRRDAPSRCSTSLSTPMPGCNGRCRSPRSSGLPVFRSRSGRRARCTCAAASSATRSSSPTNTASGWRSGSTRRPKTASTRSPRTTGHRPGWRQMPGRLDHGDEDGSTGPRLRVDADRPGHGVSWCAECWASSAGWWNRRPRRDEMTNVEDRRRWMTSISPTRRCGSRRRRTTGSTGCAPRTRCTGTRRPTVRVSGR